MTGQRWSNIRHCQQEGSCGDVSTKRYATWGGKYYCRVYFPLSMEHFGSELGVMRRNTSFACCLCSCRVCSVYVAWLVSCELSSHEQTPTCSSSTLAASGRASDARTIIVDRTMVSDKVCKDVDTLVAVIPLTSRDCLENALQKMTNGAKCQCMILDCPSTSCEACKE